MSNKIALYDILVPGEGSLVSEEIPAGQPIPAKYKDKIEGWEARGLLTDATAATEAQAVVKAEKVKEEAQQALLDAQKEEATAKAKLQEATEQALEGVTDLTSATQQASAQTAVAKAQAEKPAQAKKPASK